MFIFAVLNTNLYIMNTITLEAKVSMYSWDEMAGMFASDKSDQELLDEYLDDKYGIWEFSVMLTLYQNVMKILTPDVLLKPIYKSYKTNNDRQQAKHRWIDLSKAEHLFESGDIEKVEKDMKK